LSVVLISGGLQARPQATNADASWRKAGAGDGLRQAFERATYSLEKAGHGTYRGVNRKQRLTLEFDGREARLSHPDGSVNFHLTGYGYGDRLQRPAPATLAGNGTRMEYQRDDLTEWYVNGSQGLEQGFTLAKHPGTGRAGEALVIALSVAGELAPDQRAGEEAVLFESSKGVVLRYAGLTAVDARGRILASRLEVRGREIRLIVEDRNAQYPLIVDPTWTQQQELTAADGATDDEFGHSVAVSGDTKTAVIGAYDHYVGSNANQGAAYVFVRSGTVWTLQQELTAADGAEQDFFGYSVAVNEDTVLIGAFNKTIGSNSSQGAAYVFVRSGGVWTQQREMTAGNGAAKDLFGDSVALNGNTALIGANGKSKGRGAAYVFVRSGEVWTQQHEMTASNGAAKDQFGFSVALSDNGNTAVIGAATNTVHETYKGAAYVFVRSGEVWTQQQELAASNGHAYDYFGWSVAVSGDTAVITAYRDSGNGVGVAYVFVRSGKVWTQQKELTASDSAQYDQFGASVTVSGDTAVIGAPGKNDQGVAYVFVRSGTEWTQQQELTGSDTNFGISVALSGDILVVGAYGETNGLPGAAYVFVD
jgi:hypothetical protein